MMQITEPGFYRQRNGRKAEVVAVARGIAIGFSDADEDDVTDWKLDGSWIGDNENPRDIVDVWAEPAEPLRCWVNVYLSGLGVSESYGSAVNYAGKSATRVAVPMVELTPELERLAKDAGIL